MTRTQNSFCILACWFLISLMVVNRPATAVESDEMPQRFEASEGTPFSDYYYSVELKGSALLYRASHSKKGIRIVPTRSQWREFRRAIDDVEIWRWRPEYSGSIAGNSDWSLHIEYSDRSLVTLGHGGYPEETVPASCMGTTARRYVRYRMAVDKLLGGRLFGYRVSPRELFLLDELQLVATHPSSIVREQWAEFRDPAGEVHRIWRHPSECCTQPAKRPMVVGVERGLLREVTSVSVILREVCKDTGGDLFERDRVMKKVAVP